MKNCFSSEYEKILEEIRETIKDKKGITQALLAEELGVSRVNLNYMLNNVITMKGEYLVYLILRLGIKGLL